MKSLLPPIFFLQLCLSVNSVLHLHDVVLEPIYRFTDTSANPMSAIYFTKLPQFQSVTQNSALLNISKYPVVRGLTQEMFLKDLGCGVNTCQGLPIEVIAVYSVIDSMGRLKFETEPSSSDKVLGKAGYLAKEEAVGLISYDEYYSAEDNLFAYVNGKYPNQFGACQLLAYQKYRYKHVRTLGFAFTAVVIPNNLPIYTIFGYDDGLPEPTTISTTSAPTTPKTSTRVVFGTNPIWTLLKNSTNGIQGLGAVNLPWTPPVSAFPVKQTNICLLTGNFSLLSKCGAADRVLQYFDKNHTYFGFLDIFKGEPDTYIYSYIGFAFRSADNICKLPLVPIREFYKNGVGYNAIAGDDYTDLTAEGYTATGRILGYTIDCASAPNGIIWADIPDYMFTIAPVITSTFAPSTTPSSEVGYYVEPVVIVTPNGPTGQQGNWWGPNGTLDSSFSIANYTNVCLFTANATVLPKCGYASTLYLYYDLTDKFYFVGIKSFGRNVSSTVIGIAFQSEENVCGLNLVPIRELYKQGTGYYVAAGDNISSLVAAGYTLTGHILGYTADCNDASGGMVYGTDPKYEFTRTTSLASTTTPMPTTVNKTDQVDIFVSVAYNVTSPSGSNGYWWGRSLGSPYSIANPIQVCLFTANSTFLPTCGPTSILYQFLDADTKFYFFGVSSVGRNVASSVPIGLAFRSADNVCGLNLKPIRELYKAGVGYTVVAGDKYESLVAEGYSLTGNIMGYTVRCKNATDKMICAHLPSYNWTTAAPEVTSTEATTPSNRTDLVDVFVSVAYNVTSPSGSNGYWWGGSLDSPYSIANPIQVCLFTANSTFLPTCGPTSILYQFLDADTKFYFFGVSSVGRNVASSVPIGLAFRSADNVCGLNLKPIRELYKAGVGYTVVAGDKYDSLLAEGYSLTGNIMGYTVRCKNATDKMICAHLPSYNWTTVATTPAPTIPTTSASVEKTWYYVEPAYNVTPTTSNGIQGYHATLIIKNKFVFENRLNICMFSGNSSVVPRCGATRPINQYYENVTNYYFFGTEPFGRSINSTEPFAVVFDSTENSCGFNLVLIREMYKEGVGYTAFGGDNYTSMIEDGYVLTGNTMGYTVLCEAHDYNIVYGHLPTTNFTALTTTESPTTPNKTDQVDIFVSVAYNVTSPSGSNGYWWGRSLGSPYSIANPIQVCLFTANSTFLPTCGPTSILYQFLDADTKFYFFGVSSVGRNVASSVPIGLAFRSSDNVCGLNLKPIRELYKAGVGYTVVAGDKYDSLLAEGYNLTGNIMGYTVRCKNATDKMICAHLPSYNWTTVATTSAPTIPTTSSSLERTWYYVEPASNVTPTTSNGIQGYHGPFNINNKFVFENRLNICMFSGNRTVVPRCGATRPINQYYENVTNFYFFGTETFGRSINSTEPFAVVFDSPENFCGFNLVLIRELYKEGVGYTAFGGDNYTSMIEDGYVLTGNTMGYTVLCEAHDYNIVYGHLPTTNFTALTTTEAPTTPNKTDQVDIFVSVAYNVTSPSGSNGYWWGGSLDSPYSIANPIQVCLFTANSTFLPTCGPTSILYQFLDADTKFYFFGVSSVGRNVASSVPIGLAFRSADNVCGLNLKPIRELYKAGVGYTVVAGDKYDSLVADGYSLTGNIMGYTVRCKNATDKMICAHLPSYNWTTVATTPVPTISTTSPSLGRTMFYVEPAKNVTPTTSSGVQGYLATFHIDNKFKYQNRLNICFFTTNTSVVPRCGATRPINQYYENVTNFYFFATETFGRSINSTEPFALVFDSADNYCGLNLVIIREMYKEGVGYTAFGGDNYTSMIADGYVLTGKTMGYTVLCAEDEYNYAYGHLPTTNFTALTTTEAPTTPNKTDLVDIFVSVAYNVTSPFGSNGYWWGGSLDSPYSIANPIQVCLFTANSTFLPTCGHTSILYQYLDADTKFYFFGVSSVGRNVASSVPIGLAFRSADNVCGLNLKPIRELYKAGVGYTVVAGDKYDSLVAEGYSLTGNIMGYTVRCKNATDKMICAHLPSYNWTTVPPSSTVAPTTALKTSTAAPSTTVPETTSTVPASTSPITCTGEWSAWEVIPGSVCNDTCGNCGFVERQRTCLTCGCIGDLNDLAACGNTLCLYPRVSCCAPYVRVLDLEIRTIYCGLPASTVLPVTTKTTLRTPTVVPTSTIPATTTEESTTAPTTTIPETTTMESESTTSMKTSTFIPTSTTPATTTEESTAAPTTTIPVITSTVPEPTTSMKTSTNVPPSTVPDTTTEESTAVPTTTKPTTTASLTTTVPETTSTVVSTSTIPATTKEESTASPTTTIPETTSTIPASTTSCIGTWSDWQPAPGAVCNDTCGNCGWIEQNRVCEPAGCQCSGESGTNITRCNDGVCYFPRNSCCAPFRAGIVGNRHVCTLPPTTVLPVTTTAIATTTTEPEPTTSCIGTWSDWQPAPGAVCNDTCGNCGWIEQNRVCEPAGCQCSGESGTNFTRCNDGVCYFPRVSCCAPFKSMVRDRRQVCGLPATVAPVPTTTACTGEWSAWEVMPGSVCNDTCGNCGFVPRQRTCLTCGCIGDLNDIAACGNTVCLFPRTSCCAPYTKKIDLEIRTVYCG